MLAILLLNVGEVVSVERLIDGVWGDARPSSAKHMVHEYVSRLRQASAGMPTIATRPPGYVLEAAGAALDARQFGELTERARGHVLEGRPRDALAAYDQALALWRGDALADVALEGHAQIAATRLDQERLLVAEERVDCALSLGQHSHLIPELEHRVEEAPLRERSRAQLMLALYRAGRQTEALDRHREGRALLVDHAGVEPGRELRELERAILTQDPALELAGETHGHRRTPNGGPPPSRRRRERALVAGALLAALVIVALVLALVRSGPGTAFARLDANSAGAIDPDSNRVVAQVPVGVGPGRIAAGFGSLWVVNEFDNSLSRVAPGTSTSQTIPVCADPTAVAVASGFVWVACAGTRSVDRIDPQLSRRIQRTLIGNGPSAIAVTPGALWVTDRLDDTVTEIDSTTGKVRRKLGAGPSPSDIVYGLGALWIANESSATATRLDPETGATQEVTVGNGPEALAIGYGSIWVANGLDGTVSRIDPARNAIAATIAVGPGPSSVLASAGSIWVANSYGGRIARIDPATNAVVRRIPVGSGPQDLAALGGRIWLSARDTAPHRGGTLRLFARTVPDSLDEGRGYTNTAWTLFSITGDGLVGYKRVGGLDGGTLVPDLATAVPEASDGGRTYTFQLRRGVRYSNGDVVHASDVRRALERVFRLGSQGMSFYRGIVGADACTRSRCDLSRGVVSNDRTGSVSVHLRSPDSQILAELTLPFAYPVPREVRATGAGRSGVPGTGPYMIQSFQKAPEQGARVVLVRNPHFREWSAAAQPSGYPDRIEWTYNDALDAQLTAVEQGKADYMQSPLPAGRREEITTRYAAQVHLSPYSGTFAMFLNTRVPPFDDLRARRAVAFAVDRAQAVAEFNATDGPDGFGGVESAAVTCQIVPAGITGYRPYCPYTRNPTGNGVWTSPDLAQARRLVAASGTRGQKIVFWTGPKPLQGVVGRLAVALLDRLGYRASLKVVRDDQRFFDAVLDSRTGAQAGFYAYQEDYPAASSFLSLFTCTAFRPASATTNTNPAGICDRRIDRAVATARSLQDRNAAPNASWAVADRVITDLVPWVPLLNTRTVSVVSRRVHNVQSSPQWGVLADQMWVR